MAITASAVTPDKTLEEFRVEFNKLVQDFDGVASGNTFTQTIIFEGATADAYETTLLATDPTADRTITLPNVTGTVLTTANSDVGTTTTSSGDADFVLVDDGGVLKKITAANLGITSAADDISTGDAAVSIATSAGNITIDAQAGDTDIIFKGTDNTSDITALTLDMSEAGKAIFNGAITATTITLSADGGVVVPNDGNIGSAGSTAAMQISSGGVVTFVAIPLFPNDTIETADIQADAITGAKIADDAIDSEHYTNGSIDTAHIAADQIVASLIADDAIDSEHYTNGSIDTAHIAADQIVASLIADDAIDSEHYTDGSIDIAHVSIGAKTEVIAIACGDETTVTAAATAVVTFHMPYAFTLTGIKAGVTTAPVGSVLTIDLNEAGSTCLTTKLTIDASEKTSGTAATAAVIGGAGPALAADALMTIDVDGVGSSTAGAGLKVYLIGYQT